MVLKNTRTGNILTVTSTETIEIMTAYSDIYVPYTPVKAEEKPTAETVTEKPTKPAKGKAK